jgi:xylulokinase
MAGIILTVDIGTSSLKAAFIDFDGRLLAYSRAAYDVQAAGVGAESWKRAFALALEKLHALAPAVVIDAICVSGNGPTLVPVRRDGEALPPLYWHDGKTVLPLREAGVHQSVCPSFFLPHAAWLKRNAPAEYEGVSLFISSHEWLAFTLGAEAVTVIPHAAYEPYYWDDEQLRLFELDREKFPPFVKMGSVMGYVSEKAASSFGGFAGNRLKSGTPIIAGGPDFITALIGTLTLRPGEVCDRSGSSEGINVCAAGPFSAEDVAKNKLPKAAGLRTLPHAKEGLWNIGALIPSSGRLFEEYRRDTGQESRSYEDLLAELIPSPFPIPNSISTAPHSLLDQGRSVLCAIGFAVRSAVKTLEGAGFPVKEMRLSGGQGRNPRWNQLKADITGVSLLIPEIVDGELAGNAALSAAALGGASLEEAANRMIRFREVFRPDPAAAAFWEEMYNKRI